jgi:hypothetical protein
VYTILSKMNAFGILQWAALFYVLHLNFRADLFKATARKCWTAKYNSKAKPDSEKSRSVVLATWILIAIVSVIAVVELANCAYASISLTAHEDLQRALSTNLCGSQQHLPTEEEYDDEGNIYEVASPLHVDNLNRECAQDWSYYLLGINALPANEEESRQ